MLEVNDNKVDVKRKRINRYKKIIVTGVFALIILSVVLWLLIFFQISNIFEKLDNLETILYNKYI